MKIYKDIESSCERILAGLRLGGSVSHDELRDLTHLFREAFVKCALCEDLDCFCQLYALAEGRLQMASGCFKEGNRCKPASDNSVAKALLRARKEFHIRYAIIAIRKWRRAADLQSSRRVK